MRNKFLKTATVILLLLTLITGISYLSLNSDYSKKLIKKKIESSFNSLPGRKFKIEKIEGNLLYELKLRNVTFEVDGETFIRARSVSANYLISNLPSVILRKSLSLHNVKVEGAEVNIIKDTEGIWNYKKLKKQRKQKQKTSSTTPSSQKKSFNLYLKNCVVENSILRIIDRTKPRKIDFIIDRSLFSIDLIGLKEKFILKSQDINFTIDPYGTKIEKLKIQALITKKNIAFKNLNSFLNDIHIQGQGVLNNFKNPKFNISAYIDNYRPKGIGTFNIYIKATGSSKKYREYYGWAEISFLNSQIRGKRIWTDLKKIRMEGTRVFVEGDINTSFSRSYVKGHVDFRKALKKTGRNTLNFNVNVKEANLNESLATLGLSKKKKIDIKPEIGFTSSFILTASWTNSKDYILSSKIQNLKLGNIKTKPLFVKGETFLSKKQLDIDIVISSKEVNLSDFLKNVKHYTSLNSTIHINTSIYFSKRPLLDSLKVTAKGGFEDSTFNKYLLEKADFDFKLRDKILTINRLFIKGDGITLLAKGKGSKEKGINATYDLKVQDLKIANQFLKNKYLSGSTTAKGTIIGDIKRSKLTIDAEIKRLKYNKKLHIRSGTISISFFLDKKLQGLKTKAKFKGLKIENVFIDTLNLKAQENNSTVNIKISADIPNERILIADIYASNLFNSEKNILFQKVEFSAGKERIFSERPFNLYIDEDNIRLSPTSFIYRDGVVAFDLLYNKKKKIKANVSFSNVDSSIIALFLQSDSNWEGINNGSILIEGDIATPIVELTLNSTSFAYKGLEIGNIEMRIQNKTRKLNFDIKMQKTKDKYLHLEGSTAPFVFGKSGSDLLNRDMNINISANKFDVSFLSLLIGEISRIDGQLQGNLHLKGKINSPLLYGDIRLIESKLQLRSIANPFKIKKLELKASGDHVSIIPTTFISRKGKAQIKGDLYPKRPEGNFYIEFHNFYIRPRLMRTYIDGNMTVSITEKKKIKISGDIKTKKTKIFLKDSLKDKADEIEFVSETIEPEEFIIEDRKESSFYIDNVSIDLGVKIPADSWITGKGANIEIRGDLKVIKKFFANHTVKGNIEVIGGQYILFGKLFEVKEGNITFPDGSLTPLFNITVRHKVSGVEIFINIKGTPDKPTLALFSNPPMEKEDIISYILFGTSRDKLDTQQRNIAGEIASSILAGEVASFTGEKFGLDIDVFDIKGGTEGGLSDPQIKAGSYISDDIYIGYERKPSELPGSDNTSSYNYFNLKWKIKDSISVESSIGGENSGVDIFYEFNF